MAEGLKTSILKRSPNNRPSEAPGATMRFGRDENGLRVTFSLGGSDADTVKRLDDILIRLRSDRQPSDETLAVRQEFQQLSTTTDACQAWVANLPNIPRGGFKARTIAMELLLERGVDDWATLSRINQISDVAAIALVTNLLNRHDDLRGDELLNQPEINPLLGLIEQQPIPAADQAFVPAISPLDVKQAAIEGWNRKDDCLTHEMKQVRDEVISELRTRFGADVISARTSLYSLMGNDDISRALGDAENGGPRRPLADVKADLVAAALSRVARSYLAQALAPMIQAAGGDPRELSLTTANHILSRHQNLHDQLAAAQSPDQAREVLETFHNEIEAAIHREILLKRIKADAIGWFREELAKGLGGVPVSFVMGGDVSVLNLSVECDRLAEKISTGKYNADSDKAIEQAFKTLSSNFAKERIEFLRKIDESQIAPVARDIMKSIMLAVNKLPNIDLDGLENIADNIPIQDLVTALSGNRDVDTVFEKMGRVALLAANAVSGAINEQITPEDAEVVRKLILVMALAKNPAIFGMIRTFFLQNPDANPMSMSPDGDGQRAILFLFFKPDEQAASSNAALADMIDKFTIATPPNWNKNNTNNKSNESALISPIPAQAIYQGLKDLGLDDLSENETELLLKGPDGKAVANIVRNSAQPVTSAQLRTIVQTQFAKEATRHATIQHITALAAEYGIDATGLADSCVEVLFARNPELRGQIAEAMANAVANGGNSRDVAKAILANHNATLLTALQSFEEIKRAEAGAGERAIREIATEANLDVEDVRKHLNVNGLSLEGGSLGNLFNTVRNELGNPATDIANWDPAAVAARANERIQSFIDHKVSFLANVLNLQISDAAKGALVVETLSQPDFEDPDLPEAADSILKREEVVAVFTAARDTLLPETVAAMTDEEIFDFFEMIAQRLNEAIEEALPADKRSSIALRMILNAAFIDHCGETLLNAAARLAADDRLAAIENAGRAVHIGYLNTANGFNVQEQPVNEEAAATANKNAAAAALGIRMLGAVNNALRDDWLPAPLADALHASTATAEQKAIAAATIKRAPALLERYSAGLDADGRAELKSFLITLDLRDEALAASEEAIRAKVLEIQPPPNN